MGNATPSQSAARPTSAGRPPASVITLPLAPPPPLCSARHHGYPPPYFNPVNSVYDCADRRLACLDVITMLTPLQLSSVEHVQCARNAITSLAYLHLLPRLESLRCMENQLTSLNELCAITRLSSLYFSFNAVSSLAPLTALTLITRVEFAANGVTSLAPLARCRDLRYLYCPDNPITSLEPLAALTKLLYINISNAHVSSLEPLSKFPNLASLSVTNNHVTSLEPLASALQLGQVECGGNPIQTVAPLASLRFLRDLKCPAHTPGQAKLREALPDLRIDTAPPAERRLYKPAARLTPNPNLGSNLLATSPRQGIRRVPSGSSSSGSLSSSPEAAPHLPALPVATEATLLSPQQAPVSLSSPQRKSPPLAGAGKSPAAPAPVTYVATSPSSAIASPSTPIGAASNPAAMPLPEEVPTSRDKVRLLTQRANDALWEAEREEEEAEEAEAEGEGTMVDTRPTRL